MLEDAPVVIFDEFTSVVDRDAAKVSSAAVAKGAAAQPGPAEADRALSCHYDIVDWLDPDWLYNTADGSFARRSLRRRPPIRLRVCKATPAAWAVFGGHHYLTNRLHRSARCFVAVWEGVPVAFTSTMPLVGHTGVWREHRTVVLPGLPGRGDRQRPERMAGGVLEIVGESVHVGDEPPGDDPAPQQEREVENEAIRASKGTAVSG